MPLAASSPPAPVSRRQLRLQAGLIALFGAAAYAGGFHGTFTYDDNPAIVHNPTIHHLWPIGRVLKPLAGGMTVSGRPILNLSLAVNYAISGLDPWSYHALNLLIHLAAALCLYGLVRRTAGPPLLAFSVALVWAVHPLQTEGVMYVVQRAESLMALFYLLTLYGFVRGVQGARPAGWFALSWAACLLGMGTKEVMVSAPVIVLLYDRTFVAGSFAAAWRRRRRYYLALAATWIPLLLLVARTGGNRGGTSGFDVGVRWPAYWFTQFQAVWTYLRLSVWPNPLVFEYGPFWATSAGQVLPYALAVAPLIAATAWALRKRPAWGFLGFFFFAILAPTSLVPGTRQMIVEHRMYLPLAAVLVALAAIAGRLVRPPAARAVLLGLVAAGCLALTARRVRFYRSDEVLWSDTVAKRPHNPYALYDLGYDLSKQGRTAEAEHYYDQVLALNPRYADVRVDLGNVLIKQGKLAEALAQYREALRLNPDFPEAHNNYGNALIAAGKYAEALAEFREALRLQPEYPEAEYDRGIALADLGRMDEAEAAYRQALRLDPDYAEAHVNLGNALGMAGRLDQAAAEYRAALRLRPGLAEAHHNLGAILFRQGRGAEALAEIERAVKLRPDSAEAHNELGGLYAQAGRYPEARAQFAEALRLEPGLAAARRNLAQVERLTGGR
ncbi:MAG TPA: tetratricopeptide repeat protein [Opitutaceae bacterium]|nr:tetratricopeptide repeat protein [Opitutaceae bacterium]